MHADEEDDDGFLCCMQMEFSGLKDTNLTYEDKMKHIAYLKKKYGLDKAPERSGTRGKAE